MPYEQERRTAIEAVKQACRLCENVRNTLVSEETVAKKDKSPVTVADYGAQALVSLKLMQEFPGAHLVGEEDAAALRADNQFELRRKVVDHVQRLLGDESEAVILDAIDHGGHKGGGTGQHWTLDPIDGTKGFLRNDQYAVALALIEEGEVVLGVLGCPNLPLNMDQPEGLRGSLFIAVRGEGAYTLPLDGGEETPIRVTGLDDPAQATFCESVESGHSSHDDAAKIAELLGVSRLGVRMDSQAKYAAVARGDASIYLRLPTRADYLEKIWDHAAGAIVITEAGGKVTDVRGIPLNFGLGRELTDNTGVVATNGRLHEQVIAAVRHVLGV
jgi:3'(2'), 5'-bisphosphate nucleotidase